ncbi:hypothetical protein FPV67DRAFT_1505453 [Lyophyllum atratum]|nr:hypothetical protein FPV67DRAFT_1505453 [Lyophyllum atratum]
MIGSLTATDLDDWDLTMDVCKRASASRGNAEAAVQALGSELKASQPWVQVAAARLWAVMLYNSQEIFISRSNSDAGFLKILEELVTNPWASPPAKERALEVIAAAAYRMGNGGATDPNEPELEEQDMGLKGLWRRVKPIGKPDEGIPLNNDNSILMPNIHDPSIES